MNLDTLKKLSTDAINKINEFSEKVLRTRGGRIGSGMGLLIEALWGYYINLELEKEDFEMGWLPDHQYNDFVCLRKHEDWNEQTKQGEEYRIEVKSMNMGADESKGHFDVLLSEIGAQDVLIVIIWVWEQVADHHAVPKIKDHFIGLAQDIIFLRNELHLTRGGTFVNKANCPEQACECADDFCAYEGEPLNAAGKRERLKGPPSTRPSQKVSYAANFGGLIRMIKTSGIDSRKKFRELRKSNPAIDDYISFIHRNYPSEEENQYTRSEWNTIASLYNLDTSSLSKKEVINLVRENAPDYHTALRDSLE